MMKVTLELLSPEEEWVMWHSSSYWALYSATKNSSETQQEFNLRMATYRPIFLDRRGRK